MGYIKPRSTFWRAVCAATLFVTLSLAQTEKTREPPASVCGISNDKVARGDDVSVCLAFRAKNDRDEVLAYKYTVFRPRVDVFTQLVMEETFGSNSTFANAALVEIQVELGANEEHYARWQVYKQTIGNAAVFSSPMTVVVGASDGTIQATAWEFDCAACSSDDCMINRVLSVAKGSSTHGFCGISTVDCEKSPRRCDASVYLAWVGTDTDGNFLVSSGNILSRFRAFSISGAYKDLATSASERTDSIASRVP